MHTTECDGADLQCSSPDRWHQAFALTLNEQRWIFLPIIVSVGRQTYAFQKTAHLLNLKSPVWRMSPKSEQIIPVPCISTPVPQILLPAECMRSIGNGMRGALLTPHRTGKGLPGRVKNVRQVLLHLSDLAGRAEHLAVG